MLILVITSLTIGRKIREKKIFPFSYFSIKFEFYLKIVNKIWPLILYLLFIKCKGNSSNKAFLFLESVIKKKGLNLIY